jgi:hypothetical protein
MMRRKKEEAWDSERMKGLITRIVYGKNKKKFLN